MASEGPSCKRLRSKDNGPIGKGAGIFAGLEEFLEERIQRAFATHLGQGDAPASLHLAPAPQLEQRLAAVEQELQATRVELRKLQEHSRAAPAAAKAAAAPPAREAGGGELHGSMTLKVGSRKFQTTADTLRSVPDSFFDSLASGRVPQKVEKDGSIFIDRNPKHFQYVLDFLRCAGEGFTPPTSKTAQDELRAEADFYGLQALVLMLRRLCVASNHLMTISKKGSLLTGNRYAAAMLDVRDPSDFAITFALSGWDNSAGDSPYFVGIASADVDLAQDWQSFASPRPTPIPSPYGPMYVARYEPKPGEERFPPAIQTGLFVACPVLGRAYHGLSHVQRNACLQFITGDATLCGSSWCGSNSRPDLVRMHFVRNSEECNVEFRFSREHNAEVRKFDLSEHGLDKSGDFRPAIFFTRSRMSATIEEMVQ